MSIYIFRINTMAFARMNHVPTCSILAGRMPNRQCTTGGGFRFSGGVGPHFRLEIAGNPIDPIGKGVVDISEPSQIAGCNGVYRYPFMGPTLRAGNQTRLTTHAAVAD